MNFNIYIFNLQYRKPCRLIKTMSYVGMIDTMRLSVWRLAGISLHRFNLWASFLFTNFNKTSRILDVSTGQEKVSILNS